MALIGIAFGAGIGTGGDGFVDGGDGIATAQGDGLAENSSLGGVGLGVAVGTGGHGFNGQGGIGNASFIGRGIATETNG